MKHKKLQQDFKKYKPIESAYRQQAIGERHSLIKATLSAI